MKKFKWHFHMLLGVMLASLLTVTASWADEVEGVVRISDRGAAGQQVKQVSLNSPPPAPASTEPVSTSASAGFTTQTACSTGCENKCCNDKCCDKCNECENCCKPCLLDRIFGCGHGWCFFCPFGGFYHGGPDEGIASTRKRICETGRYKMVYAVNPFYADPRDSRVYAAEGYGLPMTVPLAPNVEHEYNYGWGIPSSRLTPVSKPAPMPVYRPVPLSSFGR